jgi:hypothetical protein
VKLGTEWHGCQLIYDGDSILAGTTPDQLESLNKYMSVFHQEYKGRMWWPPGTPDDECNMANAATIIDVHKPDDANVWIEKRTGKCFSSSQYRHPHPSGKDHHFSAPRTSWHDSYWARGFVRANGCLYELRDRETLWTPEVIYSKHKNLEKYRGKKVLLIFGGPSVNDRSWENLDVDYIWSCNQFVKNPKVAESKLDLVVLGNGLGLLEDKETQEYILENDIQVCLEPERGDDLEEYIKASKYYGVDTDRKHFFHTRCRSVMGIATRIIPYAIELGAAEIYIVGFDGRHPTETEGNLMHAFESDKPIPNWYRNYGDEFQKRQFVAFWDYILTLQNSPDYDFKLFNLGEGLSYNVTSEISKREFPLPPEILECI